MALGEHYWSKVIFEGYRTLIAPLRTLRTLLEAINLALYPPCKVPLQSCGVGNTTARVSNMTESAQPHISTSVWRSLFFYVH